jgi:four helix bundle protein
MWVETGSELPRVGGIRPKLAAGYKGGVKGVKSVKGVKGVKGLQGVKGDVMKETVAKTFEELHIYQRARELTNGVYAMTREGRFARDFGLADQIRRAAVSIMSNVAEGFERGTSAEFVQFLYIAKGSCGEVRAQLQIAHDQQYVSAADFARLQDLSRQTSGMISNFIAHLQQSSYRGEKTNRPQRTALETHHKRMRSSRTAPLSHFSDDRHQHPTDDPTT